MITPLNFNADVISKSLIDKKQGIEITLGQISGLWPILEESLSVYTPLSLALTDKGFGQRELDIACEKLTEACAEEYIPILITKCDLPFDARWFIIGDLPTMLTEAKVDKIPLPFSNFLYDELIDILNKYPQTIEEPA